MNERKNQPVKWARIAICWALAAMVFGGAGCSMMAMDDKPSGLPTNYRDLQIYATSEADADDPGLIVVTVHLVNRGDRVLGTKIRMSPNEAAVSLIARSTGLPAASCTSADVRVQTTQSPSSR